MFEEGEWWKMEWRMDEELVQWMRERKCRLLLLRCQRAGIYPQIPRNLLT
jgi:hypothetical protein